jgi:4-hydroxy-4-methyl-2-oxoglutarate aldolase
MTPLDNSEVLAYGTATLFEAYEGVRALSPSVAPLFRPILMCGPAFPVYSPAGDNLAVHLALAEAPSGSVLVVSTGGETNKGFWGEVMTEAALARGIAGLVTDGAVRDIKAIRDLKFPVFSSGVAIPGTRKRETGTRNMAIQLAGVTVFPDDIVVGDDDGVVVIPREMFPSAIQAAAARTQNESALISRLRQGELTMDLLNLRK